jgi:glutathione S-transferase
MSSRRALKSRLVAELGPNSTLIPSDPKEKALVRQWVYFADQEVS